MKKVLLAFSGGLDTSYCAIHLAKDKGFEVYTAAVNTGGFSKAEQEELEQKAKDLGISNHVCIDVEKEFYENKLYHCYNDNKQIDVFLEDYVYFSLLLLSHYEFTNNQSSLEKCNKLMDEAWNNFFNSNEGVLQKNKIQSKIFNIRAKQAKIHCAKLLVFS